MNSIQWLLQCLFFLFYIVESSAVFLYQLLVLHFLFLSLFFHTMTLQAIRWNRYIVFLFRLCICRNIAFCVYNSCDSDDESTTMMPYFIGGVSMFNDVVLRCFLSDAPLLEEMATKIMQTNFFMHDN